MTISNNAETFAGKSIVDFVAGKPIGDLKNKAYRLSVGWDDEGSLLDLLLEYLEKTEAGATEALVIGAWQADDSQASSEPVVEALVSASRKLPKLKALFIGDITYEQNEISWIVQSDMSPLFLAYPQLEEFRVRGNQDLSFGTIKHPKLKSLTVETGGLSRERVVEICNSELPALEHLELWLGSDNYGGTTTIEDLEPILNGKFTKLKSLGLKDSEIQDEVAIAVAQAPVLAQLEALDLSMGVLSDTGGAALLDSPAIKKLKKLDLHHHYLSDYMMKNIKALGIDVDLDEQEKGEEDDRYIAVSE